EASHPEGRPAGRAAKQNLAVRLKPDRSREVVAAEVREHAAARESRVHHAAAGQTREREVLGRAPVSADVDLAVRLDGHVGAGILVAGAVAKAHPAAVAKAGIE